MPSFVLAPSMPDELAVVAGRHHARDCGRRIRLHRRGRVADVGVDEPGLGRLDVAVDRRTVGRQHQGVVAGPVGGRGRERRRVIAGRVHGNRDARLRRLGRLVLNNRLARDRDRVGDAAGRVAAAAAAGWWGGAAGVAVVGVGDVVPVPGGVEPEQATSANARTRRMVIACSPLQAARAASVARITAISAHDRDLVRSRSAARCASSTAEEREQWWRGTPVGVAIHRRPWDSITWRRGRHCRPSRRRGRQRAGASR